MWFDGGLHSVYNTNPYHKSQQVSSFTSNTSLPLGAAVHTSHIQSRQAGVQVSSRTDKYSSSLMLSGTRSTISWQLQVLAQKQAMSYTDVWEKDRKLSLPPPAASQMAKDR